MSFLGLDYIAGALCLSCSQDKMSFAERSRDPVHLIWDQRGALADWGSLHLGAKKLNQIYWRWLPSANQSPSLSTKTEHEEDKTRQGSQNMQKCSLVIMESRFDDLENLISEQWVSRWLKWHWSSWTGLIKWFANKSLRWHSAKYFALEFCWNAWL